MKKLLIFMVFTFISGCSIQVVEMAVQPTEQKFDLTDSDSDGVVLAREKCIKSINGAKVNNSGCGDETAKKLRFKLLVNFESDSYVVEPEFYDEIKKLADFMKEHPKTDVMIEGHTSLVGTRAYNLELSQNRAQAVKNILINKYFIEKNRVGAIGYGFDRLLEEGNTEAINARNRRIVAEISSEIEIIDMKWTIYSVDQLVE